MLVSFVLSHVPVLQIHLDFKWLQNTLQHLVSAATACFDFCQPFVHSSNMWKVDINVAKMLLCLFKIHCEGEELGHLWRPFDFFCA